MAALFGPLLAGALVVPTEGGMVTIEHHTEVDYYGRRNPQHAAMGWGWRCSCGSCSFGWPTRDDAKDGAYRHEAGRAKAVRQS